MNFLENSTSRESVLCRTFIFQQKSDLGKMHVSHFKQQGRFLYIFFKHVFPYCLVSPEEILSTSDVLPAFAQFWLNYNDNNY